MNNQNYIRLSLELHLFFARIMKEHSFFLEAAFNEKNKDMKHIARNFQTNFESLLNQVVDLANRNISQSALNSQEFVTSTTLEAERKSSTLSGIPINQNITLKEKNLISGNVQATEQLMMTIRNLNHQALPLIQNLISFKNNILNQVLTCKMYTTNYPLLISHIMNEAKVYHDLLTRIENRQLLSRQDYYEQELFWNNIMKEHAEFIRGLLDPTERELILTADQYAMEYQKILQSYQNRPQELHQASLQETKRFQQFKTAGTNGILSCNIKSIIIPLLGDHVLREANHFLRILNEYQNISY